ncbi:uncharacterized protein CDAR_297471 [Caerostris darwini]|uniref:Uncharacterized protein n=1 Tax=Caerostris darwini TaxID=1538125 RepID=A0AAV4PMW1_9ARAC|nr:uncharacterized protein CDAR_297471 [Caerostris darwini]
MANFEAFFAFSKDAVSCMCYFYNDDWNAPCINLKSPFSQTMGEALIHFTLYHREWLHRVAEQVVPRIEDNPDEFYSFGYDLADELCGDEPFMEVLATCSFIIYIAHIFFKMGLEHYMDKAYFMIAVLLLKQKIRFKENGGWKFFHKLCLAYVETVKEEAMIYKENLRMNLPFYTEPYIKMSYDIPRAFWFDSKLDKLLNPCRTNEGISKFTESNSSSDTVISKSTEITSLSIGRNPKPTGSILKSSEDTPKFTALINKPTETFPTSTDSTTKSTEATITSSYMHQQKSSMFQSKNRKYRQADLAFYKAFLTSVETGHSDEKLIASTSSSSKTSSQSTYQTVVAFLESSSPPITITPRTINHSLGSLADAISIAWGSWIYKKLHYSEKQLSRKHWRRKSW